MGLRVLSLTAIPWLVAVLLAGCAIDVPGPYRFIENRCTWHVKATDPGTDFVIGAVLPVRLGGVTPDSDALARIQAMQLAVEDANERQGIAGRRFALRACDKGGDWVALGGTKAAHISEWMASDGVAAMITGGSNDTLAVHAATQKSGSLVMSLGATSADITHLSDDGLVWRVAPSDLYQGVVMAKLLQDKGAKNVAAVVIDNAYGESLAKVLKDNSAATVKSYAVPSKSTDVSNVVAVVAKQKPDYIMVATSTGLGTKLLDAFAKDAVLKGVPLLLSDALHKKEFIEGLADKNAIKGALGTLPGDPVGPTFDTFATNFQLRFGADATQQSFTAHSYDAAYAVILAHAWALRSDKNKKVTGADLAEGLKHLSDNTATQHVLQPTSYVAATSDLLAGKNIDVVGASGPLDFDPESGEPTSAVEVWQVAEDLSFQTLRWLQAKRTGETWTFTEVKSGK